MIGKLGPAFLQVWPGVGTHLINNPFVAQNANIGRGDCARGRMTCVSHAVGKFASFFDDHPRDVICHHHAADGEISRRESLGNRHEVRLEIIVITGKPFARAAEAADDLISHEKNLVTLTNRADFRPVRFRRHNDASSTLDRFGNKRRDAVLAQFFDFLFQFASDFFAELLGRQVAAFPIPERLADVHNVGNREAALFMHVRHAAKTGARHGAAVIGVLSADDDLLIRMAHALPEVAGHTHNGIVGFRA